MRFFKMNGIGNDYIFIEEKQVLGRDLASLAQKLCDPHTGIGADGIVLFGPSDICDLKMRIFNRDGSQAQMCGNALRCLIRHYGKKNRLVRVETKAGIRSGIYHKGGVTANLSMPVSYDTDVTEIVINGKKYYGKKVNMGNPHFVLWEKYRRRLAENISENKHYFPERTNVEFVTEQNNEIFVRVYERGCGETLACGTGAAAVTVATEKKSATIHLLGGTLYCEVNQKGEILQTGNVAYNFKGEISDV